MQCEVPVKDVADLWESGMITGILATDGEVLYTTGWVFSAAADVKEMLERHGIAWTNFQVHNVVKRADGEVVILPAHCGSVRCA